MIVLTCTLTRVGVGVGGGQCHQGTSRSITSVTMHTLATKVNCKSVIYFHAVCLVLYLWISFEMSIVPSWVADSLVVVIYGGGWYCSKLRDQLNWTIDDASIGIIIITAVNEMDLQQQLLRRRRRR